MTTSKCEVCALPCCARWHSWCVPEGEKCREPIVEYLRFCEGLARAERRNAKIFMRPDPYEGIPLDADAARRMQHPVDWAVAERALGERYWIRPTWRSV